MEWQAEKTLIPVKEETTETSDNNRSTELTVETELKPETVSQPEKHYPESVILSKGQTLRTIALDLFGSKEFWVYIYQENKHNIKNPNVIPVRSEEHTSELQSRPHLV